MSNKQTSHEPDFGEPPDYGPMVLRDRRFEAAVAAMQGLLLAITNEEAFAAFQEGCKFDAMEPEVFLAVRAVRAADALLAELERTK